MHGLNVLHKVIFYTLGVSQGLRDWFCICSLTNMKVLTKKEEDYLWCCVHLYQVFFVYAVVLKGKQSNVFKSDDQLLRIGVE